MATIEVDAGVLGRAWDALPAVAPEKEELKRAMEAANLFYVGDINAWLTAHEYAEQYAECIHCGKVFRKDGKTNNYCQVQSQSNGFWPTPHKES